MADTIRFKMIEFRRKQGLLQRDFANKVGFPPHVLSHLERGNTEWALSRIEQVCEAFNLPLSYFFFDSKSVKTKEEVALRVMEMSDEKWEAAQKFLQLIIDVDKITIEQATSYLANFHKS